MEQANYIFSKTKGEIIFANNFDKYSYAIIAFLSVVYIVVDYPNSINGLIFTWIIVIPFLMLFASHFKKVAYKIAIDLKEKKIDFHMFRNRGVVVTKIEEIQKVQNRGYLTFFIKSGEKIIWKKGTDDDDLLQLLEKIANVV